MQSGECHAQSVHLVLIVVITWAKHSHTVVLILVSVA